MQQAEDVIGLPTMAKPIGAKTENGLLNEATAIVEAAFARAEVRDAVAA